MIVSSKLRFVTLVLVAVFALVAVGGAGAAGGAAAAAEADRDLKAAKPESVGIDPKRLERLESGMRAFVDEGRLSGVVTLVARHGKTAHLSAAGVKSTATGEPLDTDSIFRIYSMTKPVTGVAMMILHEEGKWRLDDPIAKYIPEWADLKVYAGDGSEGEGDELAVEDPASPMTMRHVMSHAGGLSYGFSPHPVDQRYGAADIFDLEKPLQTMIDKLGEIPLMVHPGTQWIYSISVDVQGYLVEKLSGQSLADFFRDRIFEPLGMSDTAFYVPEEKIGRLASIHAADENGKLQPNPQMFGLLGTDATEPPILPLGGAGLFSTAEDYARFAQMLANDGELNGERILAPRTVEMMRTNHLSPEAEATMTPGLGFGMDFAVVLDSAAAGEPSREGSYYWSGAAGTWFWIDPATDLVFVGMIQHQGPEIGEIQGLSRNLIYQAIVK